MFTISIDSRIISSPKWSSPIFNHCLKCFMLGAIGAIRKRNAIKFLFCYIILDCNITILTLALGRWNVYLIWSNEPSDVWTKINKRYKIINLFIFQPSTKKLHSSWIELFQTNNIPVRLNTNVVIFNTCIIDFFIEKCWLNTNAIKQHYSTASDLQFNTPTHGF